jgi:RNA polymerase sigma-70 factor (ECF subfamily)
MTGSGGGPDDAPGRSRSTSARWPTGSGQDRTDQELLAAHLDGDPDAFGQLFNRHRDRLWAVALRTTGDPEEAADALQEALIGAFRRAGSYRGDAAVTTWLHRVVVNACLDRLRRRKVRQTEPLPDDLEGYAGSSPSSRTEWSVAPSDPAEVAVGRERRDAVVQALRSLPAEQRAALVLVDMEGFSVEETAVILQCAPGTVKSRCSRARARLVPLLSGLVDPADDAPPEEPSVRGGRHIDDSDPRPQPAPDRNQPGAARVEHLGDRGPMHHDGTTTAPGEASSSDA